jgi:DNA-binding NtrC family response regulator
MNKGNLLIVDDEPILLKNLKINLEDYADNIFTASNGLDALEVFRREKIHCIICDINMPQMNGVEVIKEVRSMDSHIPFIFYTGHRNSELMFEAVKYGAFDFLDKPYFDGLEEVISRGMKNGFNPSEQISEDEIMTEYQKLLRDIKL